MTLAAVGAHGLVLGALAAFSGATELSARLWSPLAAATVLFVALRHLGVPGTAAFVAGLVWGRFRDGWPPETTQACASASCCPWPCSHFTG